ncbi:hypothetical protein RNH31_005150 [Salmonella enterica]|nr:hypothetical protein [Salmonella enterica]EGX5147625.1 hypothetical protein [Salmonella enterica]ELF4900181.1 hypothetical protein [Salmonella enterica]
MNGSVSGKGGTLTGESVNGTGAHVTGNSHLDGNRLTGVTAHGSGLKLDGMLGHTEDSVVQGRVQPGGGDIALDGSGELITGFEGQWNENVR